MQFLGNIRLKTKIILLVAIPLVAMLFFSITLMLESSRQKTEMEAVSTLSSLASVLSTLVHETQKERGASAGFTASEGRKFAEILPNQRMQTDQKRAQLESELKTFDTSKFGKAFEEKVSVLNNELAQLSHIRGQVDQLALSFPEVAGWYTGLNAKLLEVIAEMPNLITEAELITQLTAYVNYLQSKERAGIERAVMSGTFGKDNFAPGMYKKFIELVTAQRNFIYVFETLATKEMKTFYQQAMRHDSVQQVERMRESAIERADRGGFGIDAEHWFKTITVKINQLKQVDDYIAGQVVTIANDHQKAASRQFSLFFVIVIVLLVITLGLSYQIGKAIREPIITMSDTIRKVVDEGDFNRRIENDQKDEVGEITRLLDSLFESLQHSIQESSQVVGDVAKGVLITHNPQPVPTASEAWVKFWQPHTQSAASSV